MYWGNLHDAGGCIAADLFGEVPPLDVGSGLPTCEGALRACCIAADLLGEVPPLDVGGGLSRTRGSEPSAYDDFNVVTGVGCHAFPPYLPEL